MTFSMKKKIKHFISYFQLKQPFLWNEAKIYQNHHEYNMNNRFWNFLFKKKEENKNNEKKNQAKFSSSVLFKCAEQTTTVCWNVQSQNLDKWYQRVFLMSYRIVLISSYLFRKQMKSNPKATIPFLRRNEHFYSSPLPHTKKSWIIIVTNHFKFRVCIKWIFTWN